MPLKNRTSSGHTIQNMEMMSEFSGSSPHHQSLGFSIIPRFWIVSLGILLIQNYIIDDRYSAYISVKTASIAGSSITQSEL